MVVSNRMMQEADSVRIEHVSDKGQIEILKDGLELLAGEVIDSSHELQGIEIIF